MNFTPVVKVEDKGDLNNTKAFVQAFHEAGKNRAASFIRFVDSIDSTSKPTLYFLHTLLPHVPFCYLPSGKIYDMNSTLEGLTDERWNDDERAVNQAYQRHLLQVGFVDTLLGRLIARLKDIRLYDRSLIVIAADHGVSFCASDARRPITDTNYQDILPVPLFIKEPFQQEGIINDRNVETIDILPTIADILDITFPWRVDGHSMCDPSVPERQQKVAITILSNLGKMFVSLCYREEATWRERLALGISLWPRGEVGAGVLVLSLSYGIGGPIVVVAGLSLALNLVLTGFLILIIRSLLLTKSSFAPNSVRFQGAAWPVHGDRA